MYGRRFSTPVKSLFLDFLSELKSCEPADKDIFTRFCDQVVDQRFDGHIGILDEFLLGQADFLVIFVQLSLDDLVPDLLRLLDRKSVV